METLELQLSSSSEPDGALVAAGEPRELSAEQLAARCKDGCKDSFSMLVDMFEARILNFLSKLTGNRHDAEDLTQDTFVKVYKNIHRYRPDFAFSTWLFTIAKRTAFSHMRSVKPFEEFTGDVEPDFEDPAIVLERKDQQSSLWKMARKLKPNQYEALWLRYAEGFSVAETARIMRINQIHVKVLLHRGRQQLAKHLQGREAGFPVMRPDVIMEAKPTPGGD